MRRVCTLAALTAVALSLGAGHARAAHAVAPVARRAAGDAAINAITALSILPGAGRAEVVIAINGPVSVQDFTVPNPHRVVLDITGARVGEAGRAYDRVERAGITNVRMSQYRADVVRIVLDLDGPRDYTVVRGTNEIRLTIATEAQFAAWHSGAPAMASAVSASAAVATDRAEPVKDGDANVSMGVVDAPVRSGLEVIDSITRATPRQAAPVTRVEEPQVIEAAPVRIIPAALFTGAQSQQARITVTYQDADIRDVLAAFAAFSGRTIVVGKAVTGTVTAEIKDQPWDVALNAILTAQGLAANEEATGIITVDSYDNILAKQASEPLTTQKVSINYVQASGLVQTLAGLLSKDCPAGATAPGGSGQSTCITRGSIAADSATNSLLVTEVASRLQPLLGYIKQLDVRTPQVALKAKIISVNRSATEQLGVSYDLGSAGTYFNTLAPRRVAGSTTVEQFTSSVELGGDALAGVANANRRYSNSSALNLIFSTALGRFSLTSFLDALKEQSLSDIQAEPSIVTLDNRQARILVGQETPVRVIDAGSAGQIGAPVRANVQFRETGIILTVTPHITNNRQIRMDMEAEQSELRIVGGDLGFIIDKRNARTQLIVNDGETAVIGGLTQTQIVKNKSGIPFLSDLPLIGRLFAQTDTREEKRDLLILMTPHIIDEGSAVRPPGNN